MIRNELNGVGRKLLEKTYVAIKIGSSIAALSSDGDGTINVDGRIPVENWAFGEELDFEVEVGSVDLYIRGLDSADNPIRVGRYQRVVLGAGIHYALKGPAHVKVNSGFWDVKTVSEHYLAEDEKRDYNGQQPDEPTTTLFSFRPLRLTSS